MDTPQQQHGQSATLDELLTRQRDAHLADPYPSRHVRIDRLDRLSGLVTANREEIIDAIATDFGQRPSIETRMADLSGVIGAIDFAKRHLRTWMKPQRRRTSVWFKPASNAVIAQPKGVVGVMSPWNYPVDLALQPTTSALAAGNRVMVKMSESTPLTTELLTNLVADSFSGDEVVVLGGDADVAGEFAALHFDHLVFTGSTRVGRLVAQAAAANLTPVTLELGGKSPAIISPSFSTQTAATRISWGKTFNAGQTCIAPDYVLLHPDQISDFVAEATRWFDGAHGATTDHYATIINSDAFARAEALVTDAAARGATILSVDLPAGHHPRHFPLTFVIDAPQDAAVLHEEIFAPVLPLVSSNSVDESIEYANQRDEPLAAYLFSDVDEEVAAASTQLVSGGLSINEVLAHFAQHDLGFGGIGASGSGRVHGRDGFDELSNRRAVFSQRGIGTKTGLALLYPPYGQVANRLLRQMKS